jgi:hypothetical protein
MFMLCLLKQSYKSASLGLRNLEREGKNGTRLVLRLTFALEKIEHSSENQVVLFVSLLFQQFTIFEVLNYRI